MSEQLADRGYRVFSFDLYGHGFSTRPKTRYTLSLFIEQTLEMIAYFDIEQNIELVGHSMGGAVCAGVTCRTNQVTRLVLLAPMLNYFASRKFNWLLMSPIVGDLIAYTFLRPFLVKRRQKRYQSIGKNSLAELFVQQAKLPGYVRAILGLHRHGALHDQSSVYQEVSGLRGSALKVLWGTNDQVIRKEDIVLIRELLPDHTYREYKDLEHNFLMSHPSVVVSEITER